MRPIWTLADFGSGIIPFIVILAVIAINVVKLAMRRSKEQEEERRRAAATPRSAPESRAAASAPEKKGTAAREVDRFFEGLARQSGVPVPPRRPAPPLPKPPVAAAPRPHTPVAAHHAPAARPHTPVAAHHAPAARPHPVGAAAMVPSAALSVEPEPVVELPAMDHLSPLAQAIVLRDILGPCRAFRPHRPRPRQW
jgi:hypothetical protein